MLANNETGVVQPVAELAAACRVRGIPLHTDAVGAVGKMSVALESLGVAAMSTSAHKFHGPPGIGALLVRRDVPMAPLFAGGHQQDELRPGTESVPLAVGMQAALEVWCKDQDRIGRHMNALRDRFESLVLAGCPGAVVIGAAMPRVANTSHIAFCGIDRQAMFMALDQAAVACSTGSACSSGSSEPSAVLLAMGLASDVVAGALRFSLGHSTTDRDVTEAAERIINVFNMLRRHSTPGKMPISRREPSANPL
jgi:cysteine desulfurase